MIDSVWTSDHHPSLCGTAKFSHQLAHRLGVPVNDESAKHPLISVRASEIFGTGGTSWKSLPTVHDLFLHDWWNNDGSIVPWVLEAKRVYAANEDIAKHIRSWRPDVVTLWAPSTIQGNPHRGTINVLTFGMAHKIQPAKYEKLKTILDATGEDYTVSVSTAIHEGSPWDETALVADRLRGIFGTHLRVLGYLADDALARELRDCSAVAVFYDPAVRVNNTSFWAALDAGKPIVTNLDKHSPIPNGTWQILNIDWPNPRWFSEWDFKPYVCGSSPSYGWDQLVSMLSKQPCAK